MYFKTNHTSHIRHTSDFFNALYVLYGSKINFLKIEHEKDKSIRCSHCM
jgi:hypothetical protein